MKKLMRRLSNEELALVSGGYDEWIHVPGNRPNNDWDWGSGLFDDIGNDYSDLGDSPGGPPAGEPVIVVNAPPTPDKCEANPVTVFFNGSSAQGLDGTGYYLPESVTNADLQNAWNHVVSASDSGNPLERFGEIYDMYQNQNHPHHVDFKDYPAGNISYTSTATGETVETSPFEAFGNFFFGALMTAAGFSLEETQIIAGAVQNLSGSATVAEAIAAAAEALINGELGDDPRDAPHVAFGANVAAQYILSGGPSFLTITLDTCSSTGNSNSGNSGGSGSGGGAPGNVGGPNTQIP